MFCVSHNLEAVMSILLFYHQKEGLRVPVPYSFRGLVALRSAARDGRLLPLVQDPDYLCKVDYQRLWSRRRMNRKPSKQIWASWSPRILCPSALGPSLSIGAAALEHWHITSLWQSKALYDEGSSRWTWAADDCFLFLLFLIFAQQPKNSRL